ncbi:MAG: PAS domain S-box protein, partial [Bacteroidales bacterium]|nr:PAS domain S-box protein [Bacteroidales bacterium]
MKNLICGLLILHCFNIAFTQNINSFLNETYRGGVNTENTTLYKIIKIETPLEALMLFDDGETCDCAVVSNFQGRFIIDEERISHFIIHDIPLLAINYCFAALPKNMVIIREIYKGISLIKENGELSDINNNWTGQVESISFFAKSNKIFFIGLFGLFLVVLVASFFVIYLRLKVNQKTSELQDELRQKQNSEALLMMHKNEIIKKNREIQDQNIELQSRNEKLSKLMDELSLSNRKISEALEMVKQSESRYKEFVEFLPEVVFELNNTGTFKYLNRNGLFTLGLDVDAPYEHISFFDLVHEADRDLVKLYMQQLETNKNYSKGFEYRFWGKENRLMYFFVIMMAGHDAEGMTNFKGIAIDISSRKKIQEQIRTYADVIERMEMGLYVYKLDFNENGPELFLSHCNAFSKQFMPNDILNPIGKWLADI